MGEPLPSAVQEGPVPLPIPVPISVLIQVPVPVRMEPIPGPGARSQAWGAQGRVSVLQLLQLFKG